MSFTPGRVYQNKMTTFTGNKSAYRLLTSWTFWSWSLVDAVPSCGPVTTQSNVTIFCLHAKLLRHSPFVYPSSQTERLRTAGGRICILILLVAYSCFPSKPLCFRASVLMHWKTVPTKWPRYRNSYYGIWKFQVRGMSVLLGCLIRSIICAYIYRS